MICQRKYVRYVNDHSVGEKNGKEFGTRSKIAPNPVLEKELIMS